MKTRKYIEILHELDLSEVEKKLLALHITFIKSGSFTLKRTGVKGIEMLIESAHYRRIKL